MGLNESSYSTGNKGNKSLDSSREVKQFSPVLAVQACAGYFVISVLNAEIITFVKTLYFISHKISTSHATCYMTSK